MCLKGSTNSRFGRLAAGLALLLAAGCGQAPPAAPRLALVGTADLSRLTRRHPAWSAVSVIDRTLARLPASAPSVAAPIVAVLPRPPVVPAAAPRLALENEGRRLARAQQAQLARQRERLEVARRLQIERRREEWEQEGDARATQAFQQAQADYAARYGSLAADRLAQWLNLTLQVAALEKIVLKPSLWFFSLPPTPAHPEYRAQWERDRRELETRRAQLVALNAEWTDLQARREAEHIAALARAGGIKADFVNAQAAGLETALQRADAARMDAQKRLLTRQRAELLQAGRLLSASQSAPVPTPGAQSLVLSGGSAKQSGGQNERAEIVRARLQAQRAHWTALLSDETRAAALDAAQRRGWSIRFGPARPGLPDLTPRLADALAAGVWKS